jgi:hypothetical protein
MALKRLKYPVSATTVALAIILASTTGVTSDFERPDEYAVKSGLIFNFFKFTTWPPSVREGHELAFCIMGKDQFGRSIDAMAGKIVFGRKIVIRRTAPGGSIRGCASVFIASSEAGRLQEILKSAENHAVLTISDTEGFAMRGVMINLYHEVGTVRFEINNDAVVKAGIRLSSKLLKLARRVPGEGADRR